MTFAIKKTNTIKDKITSSYCFYQFIVLSFSECIIRFSSVSFEEIAILNLITSFIRRKLIAIAIAIAIHVPDFCKSIKISFEYGLYL